MEIVLREIQARHSFPSLRPVLGEGLVALLGLQGPEMTSGQVSPRRVKGLEAPNLSSAIQDPGIMRQLIPVLVKQGQTLATLTPVLQWKQTFKGAFLQYPK